MEKKKDEKLTFKNQETESTEYVSNGDETQTGCNPIKNNSISTSPPTDNTSCLQYPLVLQWPYAPQPTLEQSVNKTLNAETPSPTNVNQRQTTVLNPPPHLQNPLNHHLPHGQLQPIPPTGSLWQHQRSTIHTPAGFHAFTPVGSTSGWQASMVINGGSSGNEPVPSFCYQGGLPYPIGFPGVWCPSPFWGQSQQPQAPLALHYPALPGGCIYIPSSPPTSDPASGRPLGIIRPSMKLSQKHQQMWEAQSAENVYLRNAVSRMEAEMATYRGRLAKLESEVTCLKAQRASTPEGPGGAGVVQPPKRGRPKRPIASVNSLPSPEDSRPRLRGRKPLSSQKKGILSSEKEILGKEGNGTKDENVNSSTNGFTSDVNGCKFTVSLDTQSQKLPTFQSQQQQPPVVAIGRGCLGSSSDLEGATHKDENQNRKTAFSSFSISSQDIKGAEASGSSFNGLEGATHKDENQNRKTAFSSFSISSQDIKGAEASGSSFNGSSNRWHSNVLQVDCSRNMRRQGSKVYPGWSFVNESASEEHDEVVGSEKDEEEETEENTNSPADDLSQPSSGPPLVAVKDFPHDLSRW